MNKVIIHGNLGAEPDFRHADGKVPVCTFSVATHERARTKGGDPVELTEWHRVVTFGKTAELCSKYLRKGDAALVEGKIRSSRWTDEEGREQLSFRIIGDSVRFLSKKGPPPTVDELPVKEEMGDGE